SRVAISAFFFVNGFLYANLMARIPEVQSFFGISNSTLGTLLFMVAIGAMVALPLTGWLTLKFGSDKIVKIAAVLFCVSVPLIVLQSNIWLAVLFGSLTGAFMGAMDVCMNGQAVYVERLYKRPINSSFHATFSIGVALGAATGGLFSKYEFSLFNHLLILSILGIGVVIFASFFTVEDLETGKKHGVEEGGFRLPTKAILPLGVIAFCSMTGEGSLTDWSAMFMNKVVGQDVTFSAVAFGVYATGMTIGRVFGDKIRASFGDRKLLIYNTLLAFAGLSISILFATPYVTLLGFFVVGLGVANIVPIIFSLAGNTPGVNPTVGISMVTSIGYTGFFVGPPTIGYLSDIFNLRIGFTFTLLLFFVMLIFVLKFIPAAQKR
ncbi:MAG: MFS transporter, partial [Spirosomaceae bacterium]|nr:MFS transporter [Spirosomataceae bacterium]